MSLFGNDPGGEALVILSSFNDLHTLIRSTEGVSPVGKKLGSCEQFSGGRFVHVYVNIP